MVPNIGNWKMRSNFLQILNFKHICVVVVVVVVVDNLWLFGRSAVCIFVAACTQDVLIRTSGERRLSNFLMSLGLRN